MVTKPTKIVLIEVTKPTKIVLMAASFGVAILYRGKRDMQNWVVVDEMYLNYLRTAENRIPRSDYGDDKYKPFFGVLFEVGDLAYVTQISHAQPRHLKMRNAPDFVKIFVPDRDNPDKDRFVAVVNLNYMFPIHKSLVKNLEYKDIGQHRTFKSEHEKSQYIDLLSKEMEAINKINMEGKAKSLYYRKATFPDDFVSKRCIDFGKMELFAQKYMEESR